MDWNMLNAICAASPAAAIMYVYMKLSARIDLIAKDIEYLKGRE